MAKKHSGNEEASGVVFDQRTKAMMATNYIPTDNVKAKINRVRECVPNNIRKDDIAIILEHFDNDTAKAVDAFTCGKADSILQTWTVSGKKGGKGSQSQTSKRKRRNRGNQNNPDNNEESRTESIQNPSKKQPSGNSNSSDIIKDATTSSAKTSSSSSGRLPQPGNNNQANQPNLNLPATATTTGGSGHPAPPGEQRRGGQQSSGRGLGERQPQGRGQQRTQEVQNRPDQRGSGDRGNQRRRDGHRGGGGDGGPNKVAAHKGASHEVEADSEESTQSKKRTGAHLEKLEKDLNRTIVSLTRCGSLLTTQLEDSERRLKKSFQEAQRQLQEREIALKNEFNDVKRQTEALIDNRRKTAAELKVKIANSDSLPEQELLELRASLKHFVSDRKTDEEIALKMRYTYNPDQLVAEIKKYGDVNSEVGRYSSRRPSISSLGTISRTTSVCEDNIPLSRGVSLTEGLKSPDSTSAAPKSPEMDLSAEADNFAAKLQERFTARGRGGPPRQFRGGRNQFSGRGRPVGGGGQRQNSGSRDQGRQRQNSGSQDNTRGRQNSGSQEAGNRSQQNRRRQDSDGDTAARKHRDSGSEGAKDPMHSPRSVGRGRQQKGQQRKESGDPESARRETQAADKVVPAYAEGSGAEEGSPPATAAGESPKKQRKFVRGNQHRRRQGTKREDGETGTDDVREAEDGAKPAEDGPKPAENGPKPAENGPKPGENGPKPAEQAESQKEKLEAAGDKPSPTENGPKPTQNGAKAMPNGSKKPEGVGEGGSNDKTEVILNGGPLANGEDSSKFEAGSTEDSHDGVVKTAKKTQEIRKVEEQGDRREEASVMTNGDVGHVGEKNGDGEGK